MQGRLPPASAGRSDESSWFRGHRPRRSGAAPGVFESGPVAGLEAGHVIRHNQPQVLWLTWGDPASGPLVEWAGDTSASHRGSICAAGSEVRADLPMSSIRVRQRQLLDELSGCVFPARGATRGGDGLTDSAGEVEVGVHVEAECAVGVRLTEPAHATGWRPCIDLRMRRAVRWTAASRSPSPRLCR